MANIVITSKGSNGIYVDFGVYASADLLSPQGFNAAFITHVTPQGGGVKVLIEGRDSQALIVSHAVLSGFMIVDTIDGVVPTSQSDLVDKITTLI